MFPTGFKLTDKIDIDGYNQLTNEEGLTKKSMESGLLKILSDMQLGKTKINRVKVASSNNNVRR